MNIFGKALTRTRMGYSAGFRFVADNKVVPVLSYGLFDRFEGPGHFWITPYEELLGPIHIGIQSAEFHFIHVLSSDRIAHKVSLNLVYQHNPRQTPKELQPGLARMSASILKNVIKNQAHSGLRLLFGQKTARELVEPSVKLELQKELFRRLSTLMRWAGITFIQQEVLLTSIIPPKFFLQSIMNEHDLKLFIDLAHESGDPDLMERMSQIHRRYSVAAAGTSQVHIVDYDDQIGRSGTDSSRNGRSPRSRGPASGPFLPIFPN